MRFDRTIERGCANTQVSVMQSLLTLSLNDTAQTLLVHTPSSDHPCPARRHPDGGARDDNRRKQDVSYRSWAGHDQAVCDFQLARGESTCRTLSMRSGAHLQLLDRRQAMRSVRTRHPRHLVRSGDVGPDTLAHEGHLVASPSSEARTSEAVFLLFACVGIRS